MQRRSLTFLALLALLAAVMPLHGQSKRPLAIEDYYRVLTVTNPQISPDGKTVRFSVTTRVETDNSTKTETFTVPTDGSAPPSKVDAAPAGDAAARAAGRGGRGGSVRVTSPDGKWSRANAGEAAAESRAEVRQRLREAPRGAVQGRDVRLEGLPARRRSRSPRRIPRAAPALQIVVQPAGERRRRRRSSTWTSGRRTSPGIRTASCSRSPPTPTCATS